MNEKKIVEWFYDHEELLLEIMDKKPYQSDGWDYEIEVVKAFLAQQSNEQVEPACWIWANGPYIDVSIEKPEFPDAEALYTHPPVPTAQPEQKPVPQDGWLQDGSLLYRLTDDLRPKNRDEINVTMADSSRSIESRTRRAGELLDRIRATHPPVPTAQPEQEPINEGRAIKLAMAEANDKRLAALKQQRTWVGLTDEEIEKIWGIHRDDDEHFDITYERDITRAIEAELQRKNDE